MDLSGINLHRGPADQFSINQIQSNAFLISSRLDDRRCAGRRTELIGGRGTFGSGLWYPHRTDLREFLDTGSSVFGGFSN